MLLACRNITCHFILIISKLIQYYQAEIVFDRLLFRDRFRFIIKIVSYVSLFLLLTLDIYLRLKKESE